MNLKETRNFDLSITGNNSGEKWFGAFTCYRRLSHRQQLAKDRIYRELLGGNNTEAATQRAIDIADMIAEMQVCLVEAPEWFKSSGYGLDLTDDNVLTEVWANVIKIRVEALEEVKKKGDEAMAELKELNPK